MRVSARRGLVLTASILAVGASAALAVSDGTYRGRTAQHRLVTLKVSGQEITNFTIVWAAHCPGGVVSPLKTFHHFLRIGPHGRWRIAGARYRASSGNGRVEYFQVSDHGAFTAGGRGRGVFSGTVRVYTSGAHPMYQFTCTSGPITFRFKRSA